MNELSKAVTSYKTGIDKYENTFSTPIILKKLGIVYEEMGELDQALKTYLALEATYPETTEGREIKKYIGRVESKMSL